MLKNNFRKIKTAVIGGVMAITAVAAPVSAVPGTVSTLTAHAADNDNYAKLLQYSLYFYDANMCGTQVSEKCQLTWRGDCHTSDAVDGGFHDAGDHAMFGLPQGFTASTLGWSYYEFKDSYDALGQTSHFKTISDYFSDFFKDCTKLSGDSVSSFCIQKGIGQTDHNYWGSPETQGDRGGCDWRSSGCGDIAAEYAASLALSYLNFGDTEDLKYAKALYNYAKNNASVSTGDCTGFYPSGSVNDDIAWAAGWLYLATNDSTYKNDCASNQQQYLGWVHGWDNVGLGAACVYAHITGDWSKVNSWIGGQCTSNSYYFLDKWGSARLNASMQFTALVATKNSSADYSSWCKNQMNYLLGDNPANTCFVVGFASNSASKPHHRAASGTSTAEDNSPSKYTLVGALVGGPTDAGGSYQDVRSDYICNEVACDYNAGLVGAAAGLYSIYKTGTLATSIEGVKSVSTTPVTPSTPATTTTTVKTPAVVTTTTVKTPSSSTGSGKYELKVNDSYDYSSMSEKMIGFYYEDFGLTANSTEKIQKVEVKLSASGSIGKWQGAFGTSTKVSPDYWTQTDQMEQSFSGNSGTVTWEVDSDTADIIQYGYEGQLKFGVWWIDCQQFSIDSVTIYTDGTGSSSAPVTTKPVTTTTTKPATTATTTTTTKPVTTTAPPVVEDVVYGDANGDGTPNVADVVSVMAHVANPQKCPMTDSGKNNCDVYQRGDGISINDAVAIQKYLTKIIESLPES